jgi:hypothetical protein
LNPRIHELASAAVPKTDISSSPAENADTAELSSIALLCCTGLLISLIVVIIRMYGLL